MHFDHGRKEGLQITATEINGTCIGKLIRNDTQKKYNIVLKIISNKSF
jgi:hypothetical protein